MDRKPADAIDAIARTPISYLGVHRVALDRVAAAHLDGLGDIFGVLARCNSVRSIERALSSILT